MHVYIFIIKNLQATQKLTVCSSQKKLIKTAYGASFCPFITRDLSRFRLNAKKEEYSALLSRIISD